ncbi:zinc finger protein 853-like [Poeciliopsis prolifica]|uniref:zinc finger protein 853-like n=1 Tax=Poeciliopsis prolifica TaxID=188132 RepID=UPI0024142942|nr:zinc finger protein 853-like [Poeciliopsis prolifica]
MDDQRRLLDFSRTPQIILHRIDFLQCHIYNQKELEPLQVKQEQEEPEDHQIKEEQNDLQHHEIKEEQEDLEHHQIKEEQEDLEHLHIKVEEKEVYCSQGEEQIELKQETDSCMVVPVDEQTYQTESEPNGNQDILEKPDETENQYQERKKLLSVTSGKRFYQNQNLTQHMRIHKNHSLSKAQLRALRRASHRDPTLEQGLEGVYDGERLVAGLLPMEPCWAQSEEETWVPPPMGRPPVRGASGVGCNV